MGTFLYLFHGCVLIHVPTNDVEAERCVWWRVVLYYNAVGLAERFIRGKDEGSS